MITKLLIAGSVPICIHSKIYIAVLKEQVKELEAEIPVGRIGKPEEFGAAVAFLCSPAAAYITGINLPVDGGRLSCL